MNYYIEMVKEFVTGEVKKPDGCILDDGEYVYACGLLLQKMIAKDQKKVASKKRYILAEIKTFHLLRVEITSMIREYEASKTNLSVEEENLIRMVKNYIPKGEQIDQVMVEVMQEALSQPQHTNRYERQERYQKKVGLVSKTYKLNADVVEQFATVCKQRGVPLGPTLTSLMQAFIQENPADMVELCDKE